MFARGGLCPPGECLNETLVALGHVLLSFRQENQWRTEGGGGAGGGRPPRAPEGGGRQNGHQSTGARERFFQ
jgi:hypothetical protein